MSLTCPISLLRDYISNYGNSKTVPILSSVILGFGCLKINYIDKHLRVYDLELTQPNHFQYNTYEI